VKMRLISPSGSSQTRAQKTEKKRSCQNSWAGIHGMRETSGDNEPPLLLHQV
jgi:hypothetical protein